VTFWRFGPERKVKLSGGHPGVFGVPIALDAGAWPESRRDTLVERLGGLPIFLHSHVQVEAMYLQPHAQIDAHSAGNDIVFLVTGGAGFVRVGEESRAVRAGDAVLWPAGVAHTAWTEDQPLQAIVVNA